MSLRIVALAISFTALPACTDWAEEFAKECGRVAKLEIHEPGLWREYVLQSIREHGAENSDGVLPGFGTSGFEVTNDWTERGRPEAPIHQIYTNDFYVRERKSGALVASARNVSLRTPEIGHIKSRDCLFDHPSLYERPAR